jgi:hypothetical protein
MTIFAYTPSSVSASAKPAGRMARRHHSSFAKAAARTMASLLHQASMKPPMKLPT